MSATEPSTSPDLAAAQAARTIALQMLEERGRGAVLVGVARVDAALEHLLQAVMTPATAKGDGLFLPERPLGSIGAKVALASRLGLIDGPVERALNVLPSCGTPLLTQRNRPRWAMPPTAPAWLRCMQTPVQTRSGHRWKRSWRLSRLRPGR